jgi:hypothetical protein
MFLILLSVFCLFASGPNLSDTEAPRLHGNVKDEKGRPVGRAEILVFSGCPGHIVDAGFDFGVAGFLNWPRFFGGPKGEFSVSLPPPRKDDSDGIFVVIRKKGFAPALLHVKDDSFKERQTVILSPQKYISGILLDENAAPIPGACLRVTLPIGAHGDFPVSYNALFPGGAAFCTGEDGAFHVPVPDDSVTFSVDVGGRGYLTLPRTLEAGAERSGLMLTLLNADALLGTVTDQDGVPLGCATARVEYADATGSPPIRRYAATNAEGRFTLLVDGGRAATARVTAEGYTVGRWGGFCGDSPVVFKLHKLGQITGLVLGGMERALQDITVESWLEENEFGTERRYQSPVSIRQTEAGFSLSGLTPGLYRFSIHSEGYAPLMVENVRIRSGLVADIGTVRLSKGAAMAGRVLGNQGEGLPAVRLTASRKTHTARTESGPDGSFRLTGLPDGTYFLRAGHADYAPYREVFSIVDGKDVSKTVRLNEGGSVFGVVMDESGRAQRDARVALRAVSGEGNTVIPSTTQADSEGRFRFDRVPDGQYSLSARASGIHVCCDAVSVTSGKDVEANISPRPVILHGSYMKHDGVAVVARLLPSPVTQTDLLTEEGASFHISGLSPGTRRFTFIRQISMIYEFLEIPVSFHLPPGVTRVRQDIQFESELTGRIVFKEKISSGDGLVTAIPVHSQADDKLTFGKISAFANPGGEFHILFPKAGDYELFFESSASGEGFKLGTFSAHARQSATGVEFMVNREE